MPSYYAEGNITDNLGGPLKGVTVQLVVNATGQRLFDPFITTTGTYSAWTDKSPYEIAVLFSKPGYADQKHQISSLMENPDIVMIPGTAFAAAPLALIAMLSFAALAMAKKKPSGKVGKVEAKTLLLIGGGLIAFSLLKQLLEKLGIWDSADTKALDTASSDPGSWWNPGYWKTKPANVSYTNPITTSTAQGLATKIYYSMGLFDDDEDAVKSVFTMLPSRAAGSYVADQFQVLYGKDLLKFLRGGYWPDDALSDSDVSEINKYVLQLPKY